MAWTKEQRRRKSKQMKKYHREKKKNGNGQIGTDHFKDLGFKMKTFTQYCCPYCEAIIAEKAHA